jgi:hypothetical protein
VRINSVDFCLAEYPDRLLLQILRLFLAEHQLKQGVATWGITLNQIQHRKKSEHEVKNNQKDRHPVDFETIAIADQQPTFHVLSELLKKLGNAIEMCS